MGQILTDGILAAIEHDAFHPASLRSKSSSAGHSQQRERIPSRRKAVPSTIGDSAMQLKQRSKSSFTAPVRNKFNAKRSGSASSPLPAASHNHGLALKRDSRQKSPLENLDRTGTPGRDSMSQRSDDPYHDTGNPTAVQRRPKRKRKRTTLSRSQRAQLLRSIASRHDLRSLKQVCTDMNIGLSNAYRLRKLFRDGKIDLAGEMLDPCGNATAPERRGRRRVCTDEDIVWLKDYARLHPGDTASDFRQALDDERGVSVTVRTVQRYLRAASFAVKQIQVQPAQRVSRKIIDARKVFVNHFLRGVASADSVRFYLDEFGVDDSNIARTGWGERGTFRASVSHVLHDCMMIPPMPKVGSFWPGARKTPGASPDVG